MEDRVDFWEDFQPPRPSTVDEFVAQDFRECMEQFKAKFNDAIAIAAKIEIPLSSWNECVHSHNLRFFTKKEYQRSTHLFKIYCSALSWNSVDGWFEIIRMKVITELLKSQKKAVAARSPPRKKNSRARNQQILRRERAEAKRKARGGGQNSKKIKH